MDRLRTVGLWLVVILMATPVIVTWAVQHDLLPYSVFEVAPMDALWIVAILAGVAAGIGAILGAAMRTPDA